MIAGVRTRLKTVMDSPNLIHDVLTLLSAPRLLVWFTLLNGIICLVLGGSLAAVADSNANAVIGRFGFGEFVALLLFCCLGGLLTFFIPLRTSGLFWGPRSGRYLDQIVLSGISPVRYFAGKVIGANLFVLMFLLASIPYFVFAIALGGFEILVVVKGVIALVIYANILCGITLVGSINASELITTPLIVIGMAIAYGMSLSPLPPFVSAFAPGGIFTGPLYSAGPNPVSNTIIVPLGASEIALSPTLIFFTSAAIILLICTAFLLCGPLHCIALPTSTFGEVSMPGANGRRSLFRRYAAIRRRSELSFFYENSSDWIERWEIPLRWGALLSVAFLLVGMALEALHVASYDFSPMEFMVATVFCWCASAILGIHVFSTDKSTEKTMVCWGSLKLTAGVVSTLAFTVFSALSTTAFFLLPTIRCSIDGGAWLRRTTDLQCVSDLSKLILPALLFALQVYFLNRWLLLKRWGKTAGFVAIMVLYLLLVFFVPLVFFTIVQEVNREAPVPQLLLQISALAAYASPYLQLDQLLELHGSSNTRLITALTIPGISLFYIVHGSLTILFMLMTWQNHRKLDPWKVSR